MTSARVGQIANGLQTSDIRGKAGRTTRAGAFAIACSSPGIDQLQILSVPIGLRWLSHKRWSMGLTRLGSPRFIVEGLADHRV